MKDKSRHNLAPLNRSYPSLVDVNEKVLEEADRSTRWVVIREEALNHRGSNHKEYGSGHQRGSSESEANRMHLCWGAEDAARVDGISVVR